MDAKYIPFKERKTHAVRLQESRSIKKRYPLKVPVIVERLKGEKQLPLLEKVKFLVPEDMCISQFMFVVRSRMLTLSPQQSLHFIINSSEIPSMQLTMGEIYGRYADEDGFRYLRYAATAMFG
ncbi:Oidioi.mRNA.OKI2018_I69.chr1.g1854.t1.cds [Oikopleura dioica]|uniref:Oidioi.mRNA.OKI2018_I69.chr1.g1854.t1.cds n=1 Tax=Oikopleura dioica TaxID=34765 RepID=A0ABN7SUH1_OIKDI|nr:Oidioi.mRNA.OKI2018_I69.chr1.g1854.t1.cds [Oikopleura dioica]